MINSNTIHENKINSTIIITMIKSILLFGFLFNIHLSFAPKWAQSKMIAFSIFIIWAFFRNPIIIIKKTLSIYKIEKMIMLNVFLFFYSIIVLLSVGIGTGDIFILYILRFFLFGIFGSIIFFLAFSDLNEFMRCLRGAVLLQALMILVFILCPSFQLFMDELFVTISNTTNAALRARGYITGIGCTASSGFLKMAPGIAASMYFVLTDSHFKKNISILFIILLSGIMLSRTGFVFSFIALIVLLYGAGTTKKLIKRLVLSMLMLLLVGVIISYVFDFSEILGNSLYRLERLLREGINDPFFTNYQRGYSVVIPELSWDTIIGIGVISGYAGNGIRIDGVDGGYLRLYAAIGLPLTILIYAILCWLLFSPIKNIKERKFRCIMIFMMFYIVLGEIKEFLIYVGFAIGLYYAMLLLYEKGETGKCTTL